MGYWFQPTLAHVCPDVVLRRMIISIIEKKPQLWAYIIRNSLGREEQLIPPNWFKGKSIGTPLYLKDLEGEEKHTVSCNIPHQSIINNQTISGVKFYWWNIPIDEILMSEACRAEAEGRGFRPYDGTAGVQINVLSRGKSHGAEQFLFRGVAICHPLCWGRLMAIIPGWRPWRREMRRQFCCEELEEWTIFVQVSYSTWPYLEDFSDHPSVGILSSFTLYDIVCKIM